MTTTTDRQHRLLALCAIRIDNESVDWSLIAHEAQFQDGLDSLWSGQVQDCSTVGEPTLRQATDGRDRRTSP